MISARKAESNRVNAQASTGPKTAGGKARAARNARRHGLSLSILADPAHVAEVDYLAHEIAGEGAFPEILELARPVAESQIDLVRIRHARYDFYIRNLKTPKFTYVQESLSSVVGEMRVLRRFMRQFGPTTPLPPGMAEALSCRDEGLKESVFNLTDLTKEIIAMDRYERRALSRRKFAIRALDRARQLTCRDDS